MTDRNQGRHRHRGAERTGNAVRTTIRLLRRLAPQRRRVAIVIGLSVGACILGVIGPRILGQATDLIFNGLKGRRPPAEMSGNDVTPGAGIDFGAIGRALLLALGVYLAAALMMWAQMRVLKSAIQHTLSALRADVEDKLHRLPLSYVDAWPRGELLGRVTNDVAHLDETLVMVVSELPTAVLTVTAVLVMMLTMSPLLAMVAALTVPLSALLTRLIMPPARRFYAAQAAHCGRLNAHIEEIYSGVDLVQLFGQRARAQEQFDVHNAEVRRAGVRAHFVSGLIHPATTFIGNLSYVAVALVGGLQMVSGQLTLGGIQAFIQYVRQFNHPVSEVATISNTLLAGVASAQRVFELLDAPEDDSDVARTPIEITTGRVEFDHVTFGYRSAAPVIEDLSLTVEPGSTVAIVGPTGAGKSTLVNLLMRFYEVDCGRIMLDGHDIATIDAQSLRSKMGMVPQETWVFAGSIADNIGYGRPGASRAEIIEAATAANVDHFVGALPDGYDTLIDENGSNLSAGQKQLITIARAFLARPQLLILDEATGSVDVRTEVVIQHAMAELCRDRTCFVITHRPSTIRDADVILVMDAGRIIELGSHSELVARRGVYYSMTQAATPTADGADDGSRGAALEHARVPTPELLRRPSVGSARRVGAVVAPLRKMRQPPARVDEHSHPPRAVVG